MNQMYGQSKQIPVSHTGNQFWSEVEISSCVQDRNKTTLELQTVRNFNFQQLHAHIKIVRVFNALHRKWLWYSLNINTKGSQILKQCIKGHQSLQILMKKFPS